MTIREALESIALGLIFSLPIWLGIVLDRL